MTNTIPQNITSYDTGQKPYKHDVGRGKWASRWDYYAVALSSCFGFRYFLLQFLVERSNIFIMGLAYLLGMITFILPLYYTQMFLGQFSSTGIISVFRIAPLFKCIGYVSTFLNIVTSSYFAVIASFPLYIIFESMQPYLPWSHCGNHYNKEECTLLQPGKINFSDFRPVYFLANNKTFPVNDYLEYLLNTDNLAENWQFLWRSMLCTFLIWILVGLVLYFGVEMFGKILRFITPILFIALLLVTIRVFCEHESFEVLKDFFTVRFISFNNLEFFFGSPLFLLVAFGSGWGSVLTIASYNNFNEDFGKMSLITCSIQMVVFLITGVNCKAVTQFLTDRYNFANIFYFRSDIVSKVFVTYAFYFTHLSWPHLWTILFFLAIFISQFCEVAVQILTITTAIFDEFEYMRIYKRPFLILLIAILSIGSIVFCTTDGFNAIFSFYHLFGADKIFLIYMELLIILWIYGRMRFQRDVKFISGKAIQSWKIWMMRFLLPVMLLLPLVFSIAVALYYEANEGAYVLIYAIITLKVLPLLSIPGYMIQKIYSSTGHVWQRIKNLCVPNDWYPANPIDHRNYEKYLGNSDMMNEAVNANMEHENI